MIRALKENWALFAGMLMLMASNGLLVTLITVRSNAIGLSETAIGFMQAAYPLGALFGCLYAPRLIEQVGHVRAFGALASLCSISAIVHLLTGDFWSWTAMRLLSGLCYPGLYVIAESWLNAKAENRSRAMTLSIYFVIQTLGPALGTAMVGLPGNPVSALVCGRIFLVPLIGKMLGLGDAAPCAQQAVLAADLDLVAKYGRIIVIGNRGEITINPRMAMMKELDIRGLALFNGSRGEMEALTADLLAGLADGTLRPVIGREMPLAQAAEGQIAVLEPGAHGKIVLVP